MRIINPLYDKAFKYLMQNNRLAKKVLSVILEEDIEELELKQQETVVPDEKRGLTLFRLDFKAIICRADGTRQQVLIELQKSKFETDIQRFRSYLGPGYLHGETTKDDKGHDSKAVFPIITIYILGYPIQDIPHMAVTVNRHIINSVSKETLDIDSFFINHLTHRSHILQVRRLPENRQSRLEQFLMLFNQAWITEHNYIIDLQEIPEEFQEIAKYLQGPVMNEQFRRQLEAEEEIDTIFDRQEAKLVQALQEAEEAKQKAEAERKQKEEKEQTIINLIKKLHLKGFSISEIAEDTGKSNEDVTRILQKQ